ncbi:MAG: restriction endonuclease [Dictyoglomus sp. NZ13-RE01]|nr:MAG: restriction endonuclease [Dictyoglomus sp. NZ13-RE01]
MKVKENGFKETEIGLIPEDWEVVRLKDVAVYMKAGGTPRRTVKDYWNGDIPFVKIEDITSSNKYILTTKEYITKKGLENSSAWLVPENSILLSMYASIGEVALTKFPVATNQAILAIIPNTDKVSIDFLYYSLKFHEEKLSSYTVQTTQKNVNKAITENLLIPLPPLDEQKKIAKVLDKIQQAIEIQDKIIENTKNLKKSLMQKLFTEGLYGEEQKETEIGLIPKSWEVVRLGEVAVLNLGRTPDRSIKKYWENGSIPWVKIQDLNNNIIYDTSEKISDIAFKEKFGNKFVPQGTILLSFKLTIGRVGILGIDAVHHEGIVSLFLNEDKVNKEFLFFLLQNMDYNDYIDNYVKGKTLNKEKLKILPIPLPPLEEQKEIAHILSTVDKKIEIEQKRKEVLKRLFKTMLHKLMTGEIRLKEIDL